MVRAGQFRGHYAFVREDDPHFWDPAVPDGESVFGPGGLDSKRNKDLTKKADQVGNYYEWRDQVCAYISRTSSCKYPIGTAF